MFLLSIFGASCVSLAFVSVWWALSGERPNATVARNLASGLAPVTDLRRAMLAHSASERALVPAVERLAARARRLTPAGMLDALERRVLLAGVPADWPIERVLAAKLVLGAAGATTGVALLLGQPSALNLALAAGFAALGWFTPDIVLHGRADRRQKEIQRALPDTLDQVTISVEAGLGFEAALARAGRTGAGPLAEELRRTLQDVHAGMARSDALKALVGRTDVPELRHFVSAVLQAESYGVPIAQVLRVQAGELRVKRRQRAEERAMKLPVKVVFPLVLCILPTLFIVILGPAAIRIAHVFAG
jgi:tight adherence protein C